MHLANSMKLLVTFFFVLGGISGLMVGVYIGVYIQTLKEKGEIE